MTQGVSTMQPASTLVVALDHVPHCYTYEDGLFLANIVAQHLKHQSGAVLSFGGVTDVATSFIHGLFLTLVRDFSVDRVRKQIRVIDSTHQINSLIRTRVQAVDQIAAG